MSYNQKIFTSGGTKMDNNLLQHGAISWFELMTTDVEAAKGFYGTLFGWKYEAYAGDPAAQYHMLKVNDEPVGGIMKTPPQCSGYPPIWGAYVTVADIDATAAKVVELGGKVIVPPTDIPNIGRFSVFSDPQGAVLSAITYFPRQP